jgi:hypothetical protein
MKYWIYSIIILLSAVSFNQYLSATIVQTDNNTPGGTYSTTKFVAWEESSCIKPAGPCRINSIHLYLSGAIARKDSIQVLQDPTDGGIPPTRFVWKYSQRCPPVNFNYSGTPGWIVLDVSSLNLHFDGYDRIVIQHVIPSGGPYFTFDNNGTSTPLNSYLCDALTPNPNFNNTRGTLFYKADGDFMVRLEVEYDYPLAETSAPPPYPQMLDVTKEAGLVDGSGNPLKNALVSVVDWNYDGFDDVAIGSVFFQNNGDGTFKNVTQSNVIAGSTVWADYNNDGKMDFFANNGGMPSEQVYDQIYTGNGDGTYNADENGDITLDYPTVTPMWLDYNNDGFLDLFIAYGRKTVGTAEQYFPDQLFQNMGNGRFTNVTKKAKIDMGEPSPYYDCWGASICDYNNDNLPDIFVATYRLAPDKLYKNLGDGTFQDVSASTGAQGVPTNSPGYFGHGMGSDWCDYNNDGYTDFAVGNLGHPDERGLSSNPSLLFRNQGPPDYKFTENHFDMGLKFFEMNAGIVWADFNLDSYADLFHCQYSYDQKGAGQDRLSRLYMNSGPDNNYKLIDKTWEYGSLIHGAWSPVVLDYDNDGDMDLLVASSNESVKLFRNDITDKGNWISFRLYGSKEVKTNRDAFGSTFTLYAGGKKIFRQLPGSKITARASQSTNEYNFGIGNVDKIDSMIVTFQNGKIIKIPAFTPNRKHILYSKDLLFALGWTAPMQTYPANDMLLTVTNPDFKWTTIYGSGSYEIQISDSKDMVNIIENKEVPNNYHKAVNLQTNKIYYWRVRSIQHSKEPGSWSSVWSFKTGDLTDVEESAITDDINIEIKPNPVQSLAEIEITMNNSSDVIIDIFDLLGNRIANLCSTQFDTGKHTMYWEPGNITQGVYNIILHSGNAFITKKFYLIK